MVNGRGETSIERTAGAGRNRLAPLLLVAALLMAQISPASASDLPCSRTARVSKRACSADATSAVCRRATNRHNQCLAKQETFVCPAVYQPVCAVQGDRAVTFSNSCAARLAGADVVFAGTC